jgi:predicted nucleic acid-binding protein
MRLVVDTSVLVGELLRKAGRERLADQRLDLFIPERMWAETQLELPRRITAFARRHGLDRGSADELVRSCLHAVDANVISIDNAVYAPLEDEARERCPRDLSDWPVVASALVLSAPIWTNDGDFLGTGVATWTTDTLQRWLDRQPPAD